MSPRVWVDALAFDEEIREGRLTEALPLVRGEPLAGMDDEWIYEYRDEHRVRLSSLLEKLADLAESESQSIDWSRRRVSLVCSMRTLSGPSSSSRLIAAWDCSGALAVYGRFRQRLRTELGISPFPRDARPRL